jgi:hypothetical protein
MRKSLSIISANIDNNHLYLETTESIKSLQPSGQILVDSDHFSFIYLMEDNEDYTYIILPEQHWPVLKSAYEQNYSVWLTYQAERTELTNFQEELEYVINNIKGNSNYGEEMVTKVESYF